MKRLLKVLKGLGVFCREYLLIECILPISPVVIEYLMKRHFPALGTFTLYEKPLAISAMMVPMVAFIKSDVRQQFIRFLFGALILTGVALLVMSIIFDSPGWKANYPLGTELHHCYKCSLIGLLITLGLGVCTSLWQNSLRHFWQNDDPPPPLDIS